MPYFLIALAITTALYVKRVRKTRRSVPLPPGPPPLPLIGNALDLPRRHLGREFMEMSKKYGMRVDLVTTVDQSLIHPS